MSPSEGLSIKGRARWFDSVAGTLQLEVDFETFMT